MNRANQLINRANIEQQACIAQGNMDRFCFYHSLALKLIGYKLNVLSGDINRL